MTAKEEIDKLYEQLMHVRSLIADYDMGDRPMSPPARLLRKERELSEQLRELRKEKQG